MDLPLLPDDRLVVPDDLEPDDDRMVLLEEVRVEERLIEDLPDDLFIVDRVREVLPLLIVPELRLVLLVGE